LHKRGGEEMPYINSKVNVKISKEQEILLKGKLGEAIPDLYKI